MFLSSVVHLPTSWTLVLSPPRDLRADDTDIRVTTEYILQQVGEFGVTIRNVAALALLSELVDYLPQCEQTRVSIFSGLIYTSG